MIDANSDLWPGPHVPRGRSRPSDIRRARIRDDVSKLVSGWRDAGLLTARNAGDISRHVQERLIDTIVHQQMVIDDMRADVERARNIELRANIARMNRV